MLNPALDHLFTKCSTVQQLKCAPGMYPSFFFKSHKKTLVICYKDTRSSSLDRHKQEHITDAPDINKLLFEFFFLRSHDDITLKTTKLKTEIQCVADYSKNPHIRIRTPIFQRQAEMVLTYWKSSLKSGCLGPRFLFLTG